MASSSASPESHLLVRVIGCLEQLLTEQKETNTILIEKLLNEQKKTNTILSEMRLALLRPDERQTQEVMNDVAKAWADDLTDWAEHSAAYENGIQMEADKLEQHDKYESDIINRDCHIVAERLAQEGQIQPEVGYVEDPIETVEDTVEDPIEDVEDPIETVEDTDEVEETPEEVEETPEEVEETPEEVEETPEEVEETPEEVEETPERGQAVLRARRTEADRNPPIVEETTQELYLEDTDDEHLRGQAVLRARPTEADRNPPIDERQTQEVMNDVSKAWAGDLTAWAAHSAADEDGIHMEAGRLEQEDRIHRPCDKVVAEQLAQKGQVEPSTDDEHLQGQAVLRAHRTEADRNPPIDVHLSKRQEMELLEQEQNPRPQSRMNNVHVVEETVWTDHDDLLLVKFWTERKLNQRAVRWDEIASEISSRGGRKDPDSCETRLDRLTRRVKSSAVKLRRGEAYHLLAKFFQEHSS